MKNKLYSAALGLLLCAPAAGVFAQVQKADSRREANFIYEVKVIDEFIERFNDEPTSALRREYLRAGKNINFTRRDLIGSLFEQPSASKDSLAQNFAAQVDDTLHPQVISFNDSAWYAEVQCAFNSGGRKVSIPLIMQVNTAPDKSSKWMIAGIGDSPVFLEDGGKPAVAAKNTAQAFISPSDYATNFLELHHILAAGMNPGNYFVPELLATPRGQKFVQLIQSRKLAFEYPGAMKFYFFQIPNYTFTVERFVRSTAHSGWLITALLPTTPEQKLARKGKLLQRTL